ncbi:hypothetical protein [Pseudomonas sp.]|jgi:hypothetical protein|uniref:hypothetical protein n=1 Tax=Pseudomonas sp. TaxID=306 RepID=UPI0037C78116
MMVYFRFSLVFVAIFVGAMLYGVLVAEGSLVGFGVLSLFMLLGTAAIFTFFSRNKQLIKQYAKKPDVELLKKLIVGNHNRTKGEKTDA